MTLLHVAAGNGYGGIERMLVTMAGLHRPAIRQAFALSFPGRLERELRAAGAAVHLLPSPRASRPMLILRARRALTGVLDAVRPSAVLFHGAWPHAMFAAAARGAGVRVGFWQHQPIARPAWPDWWARRVRPDFAIYNSAFSAARPAFPDVTGRVVHCPVLPVPGLNAAERQRMRGRLGASAADFVVLMAARMEAWKGHEVLLDSALSLGLPGVRIWIAGGAQRPQEARYLAQLAARAAVPPLVSIVSILGERDDVPVLMRLADAYCQPNLRAEPFGIAIAEAMHAGLPCVVSAPGGAAELLDDESGIVVEPGDARAVAAALRRLALDPALRIRMGNRAAERAGRLTDPESRLAELAGIVADLAA